MSALLVVLFSAAGAGFAAWSLMFLLTGFGGTANAKGHTLSAPSAERRDVFLSREELLAMVRHGWALLGSAGRAPDTGAAQRHPGWRTTEALDALLYAQVVSTRLVLAIECEGAWLRPTGVVLVVRAGQDRDDVLARAVQADKYGASESHVYLSLQDFYDLANHNNRTQLERGYHHRHVASRYPGWTWDELHGALQRSGQLCRRYRWGTAALQLPKGFTGVLIERAGKVVLDDGSLEHPARSASWTRQDRTRLSEHCVAHKVITGSPVIVHAPHTSLHIPTAVRAELLVNDEELWHELAVMTDSGVSSVVSRLNKLPEEERPSVVTATMSRLVFDPERFPDGDTMEAVGMGLVYTRRADGSPLRGELTPERLSWYRSQHCAYTESLERVVDATLERFGTAVIIDLHSYPREPLGYEDPTRSRPEVCLGTDSFHSPSWLREAAEKVLSACFETGVDSPFSGAYVPGRFYRTDPRVHAVMLEFRRDVLEDPGSLTTSVRAIQAVLRTALRYSVASRGEVRRV